MIVKLREQREKAGMQRLAKISELTGYPQEELAPLGNPSDSIHHLSCDAGRILSGLQWNTFEQRYGLETDHSGNRHSYR